jgi:glycosyltransferase involved in cell wall biosynthesis
MTTFRATDPSARWLDWLRSFEERHGRPLRVLHVGNIANNAYINAKIQRRLGIEADVVCYDYYHAMGCPEWEDADFAGTIGDPDYPDWWAVDLGGFRRPPWFAQGRLATCQRYLAAVRSGRSIAARVLWRRLRAETWLRCRSTRTARVLALALGVPRAGAQRPAGLGRVAPLARRVVVQARFRGARAAYLVRRFLVLGGRKSVAALRAAVVVATTRDWRLAALTVFPTRLAALAATAEHRAYLERARGFAPASEAGETFVEVFARLFPEREPLRADDLDWYAYRAEAWRDLVACYDVVQGYATDAAVPLLAGHPSWAAYEHGTLRTLPFEATPRGRVCALSYRLAPAVFVTNSDVLPAARRLGLAPEQTVYLPHAVESDKLERFAEQHRELAPPRDTVVLFSPTRHDWVDGDPLWSKGNDRFLRAVADVAGAHPRLRVVLVEWGRHVSESRRLVEELGIADLVEWIEPLRKRGLWARYLQSHAVVDQFVAPAMGSVAFESLALGRRVVSALDDATSTAFFGVRPPLLDCRDEESIADRLRQVLADPHDEARIGAASRDWFSRYHSTERILALELEAYARILEPLELRARVTASS